MSSAKAKAVARAPVRRAATATRPVSSAKAPPKKAESAAKKTAAKAKPAVSTAPARKHAPAPVQDPVATKAAPAAPPQKKPLVLKPVAEKSAERPVEAPAESELRVPEPADSASAPAAHLSETQADSPVPEAASPPPPKNDAIAPTEEPQQALETPDPAPVETIAPSRPGFPPARQLPPRPPGKPEVFEEGDHVVYPTHGVGKVERIAVEEIAGHKLELIHITFEENRMTLRVPVTKARTAGLRKLATRKMFDEALAILKGRARIKRTMWSRRAQEYEAKINSGDPLAIAEVVRDLHRNAGQPDQSFSERQIYEAAMDRLAAELAALDKTDKATAATKLSDFLKTV